MSQYNLNPELNSLRKMKAIINKPLLPFLNFFMKIVFRLTSDSEVSVKTYMVQGYKSEAINVSIIEPKTKIEGKRSTLIFFHGGAFCLRASGAHFRLAKEYALRLSCKVIYADYRLAPKYLFPYALEDCFATYKWVLKNADKLNIDVNRLIIGGDSAGGNLAIGVTMLAMKKKLLLPKAELLIYPVTDRRMMTQSMKEFTDTPVWNAKLNKKLWKMYLSNAKDQIEYISPMEHDSFEGFPQTYIEVAEFDCLRDEGIAFGEKLKENAVNVELIEVKGACHGFETVTNSSITRNAMDRRIAFCNNIMA